MTIELFDNIAESNINPSGPTDGWGSLEENSGRYWLNTTTNVKFFHNGIVWVNYDPSDGMSVSRTGVTLKTTGQSDLLLQNTGGQLTVNGAGIGGAGIQSYTTVNLPSNTNTGTIAFDLTLGCPVYSNNNIWYKISDNSIVSDNTLDLYLFAGQSNMDGRGDISGATTVDRTNTLFYKETATSSSSVIDSTWSGMVLGQTCNQFANKFGPEIAFHDRAKQLPDFYDKRLAILKFAHGGTNLGEDWNTTFSDNYMFDKFKDAITDGTNKLTTGGYTYNIKGLVWFQGESDTSNITFTANYQTNLSNFISAIRTYVSIPQLPVFICSIINTAELTNALTVRTAQQAVASGDLNIYYIPTETYSHYDSVHLDANGQLATGTAIANTLGVPYPATITTLAWYDATGGNGMTVVGGKVSQWDDKSGNSRHITQTNNSSRPSYSNSEVQFIGNNNQHLFNTSPFLYNNNSIEIYIVAKSAPQGVGKNWVIAEGKSNTQNGQYSFIARNSGSRNELGSFMRNDGNTQMFSNNAQICSTTAFDNTYKLWYWRDTGSSLHGRVDGLNEGSSSYNRSGTFTPDQFCVGGVLRTNFLGQFTGSIKEIVITDIQSTLNREKMEDYLSNKWNY